MKDRSRETQMRLIIVGPGRAGGAVALAAQRAGHTITGVIARRPDAAEKAAQRFGSRAVGWDAPLPACDLAIVAVRDDAIAGVAERLAGHMDRVAAAVHLSGLVSVAALDPLVAGGVVTGSMHPLQTLPTADLGAARIEGASFAITAVGALRKRLHEFASSLGALPFDLIDASKPLYHAAAVAAANVPVASLALAADLLEAAGVPFSHARPLVEAVVANAFDIGPRGALTGPVARGDYDTVRAHLEAIAGSNRVWAAQYRDAVRLVAAVAGKDADYRDLLR